jgi:AMMECR1 domain-containing protein
MQVYSGSMFPEVALRAGWTKADTLKHLYRKCGMWRSEAHAHAIRRSIQVRRFQATTATLTFQQYQELQASSGR